MSCTIPSSSRVRCRGLFLFLAISSSIPRESSLWRLTVLLTLVEGRLSESASSYLSPVPLLEPLFLLFLVLFLFLFPLDLPIDFYPDLRGLSSSLQRSSPSSIIWSFTASFRLLRSYLEISETQGPVWSRGRLIVLGMEIALFSIPRISSPPWP